MIDPSRLARAYLGRIKSDPGDTEERRDATRHAVYVREANIGVRPLTLNAARHSPDGVAWGYAGSGPSELARQMLWDLLGAEPTPECYQDFKAAMIVPLPQDQEWELPAVAVSEWVDGWRATHPGRPVTVAEYSRMLDAEAGS